MHTVYLQCEGIIVFNIVTLPEMLPNNYKRCDGEIIALSCLSNEQGVI